MPSRRSLLAAGLLLAAVTSVLAQAPPKRPLRHSDYDIWNTASGVSLSPDGKWLAYTLMPAEGDGHLIVRSTATDAEHRIARGGRPSGDGPGGSEEATPAFLPVGGGAVFSPDGKRVFATLAPTKAEVEQAKTAKTKAEPKLAVVEVASGKVIERIPKVRRFEVTGEGAGLLLIHKEPKPEEQPSPVATGAVAGGTAAAPATPSPSGPPSTGGPGGSRRFQRPGGPTPSAGTPTTPVAPRPVFGTELVVRNLADGSERSVPDVTEYRLTKDHQLLVYAAASKKDDTNGMYVIELGSKAPPQPVQVGKGRYSRLTWDKKQTRLAFVFDETAPPEPPAAPTTPGTPAPPPPRASDKVKVFVLDRSTRKAVELLTAKPAGIKDGFVLSGTGNLRFTDDGKKLAVTVVPLPPETPRPAAPTNPAERIDLDIWHWKDEQIQPMQRLRGPVDRVRSQPAAYFFDTKTFRQLGDDERTAGVPDHGDWAVSNSDKPYRYLTGYGGQLNDYALVNVRTGEVKSVLTAAVNTLIVSPKGSAAIHFDGKDWHAVAIPSGAKRNLTEKLAVKFFDEEHDSPSEPPSYGFAGWTADETAALVYDRFDLWKLPVDGSTPTNISAVGRGASVRLRLNRLRTDDEDDEPGIDLSKPLLYSATDLSNYDTGFYRQEAGGPPKRLVMGARRYGPPVKAKKADTLLVSISTFADAPDYYATGPDFREFRRVTDTQPRKAEFNWGKAELMTYKTLDGVELKGILVKPEDFDPAKKYPMIVYIYERLSQNLHGYRPPSAGTSINPTYYASNGYLVFMPDIAYTIGAPGQSALKCVLPAIQAVVDKGCVSEAAIGIQGHSWGGYQIAYMVTQTNRFKAAAAGAPVSDMVSAYGGVRWGSGLPRQFQYERTQSRIGAKLWDAPLKYIENSPIFQADRVKTPLMILHNDQDDAVPWYQGIEYYLALRRLGKECYLFNYNGEFHGLRKKATQRDYTLRMQQFFDHHLKGAPMPEWMAKGVPYADREKEKEQWKGLFKAEGK